jgi:hypothetical protein
MEESGDVKVVTEDICDSVSLRVGQVERIDEAVDLRIHSGYCAGR